MQIKEELTKIVGAGNAVDNLEWLQFFSQDNSLETPHMPQYIVKPQNTREIEEIVKLANIHKVPITPCSSGVHFYGNTIPKLGGIILDLRRMSKILDINLNNKSVRIEPGVTWGKLQSVLAKDNMMALCPLLPHPMKSVVTSHLEREPMLIPKHEYAGSLVSVEAVFANGEVKRTGSACVPGFPDNSMAEGVNPGGPGYLSWQWILQGAQGTIGIVTWAQIKIAPRPKINKTFLIQFDHLEGAIELVYNLQKRMLGEECLIINNVNLATILAPKWTADYEQIKNSLKPWIVVFISGGGWRLPEEKIEYEEQGLREAAAELHISELPTSIQIVPGIENELPDMLRSAWPEKRTYWKFASKGGCQDVFFHTTLNRSAEFVRAINNVAMKHDYSSTDIGYYFQPLEYGRACHLESNFAYNPKDALELQKMTSLFAEIAEKCLEMGAFFSRPYGSLADLVYSRAASYTAALKKVKEIVDPQNILSPGRLCF